METTELEPAYPVKVNIQKSEDKDRMETVNTPESHYNINNVQVIPQVNNIMCPKVNKTTFQYSNSKNKMKYSYPNEDKSEEELQMYTDQRNIYEIFRDLIKKINDQIPKNQIENFINICKYDIRIPQYSENGLCMLKEDIAKLVKDWRRQGNLSIKDKTTIDEIEKFNDEINEETLPKEVKDGGYTVQPKKLKKQPKALQLKDVKSTNLVKQKQPSHSLEPSEPSNDYSTNQLQSSTSSSGNHDDPDPDECLNCSCCFHNPESRTEEKEIEDYQFQCLNIKKKPTKMKLSSEERNEKEIHNLKIAKECYEKLKEKVQWEKDKGKIERIGKIMQKFQQGYKNKRLRKTLSILTRENYSDEVNKDRKEESMQLYKIQSEKDQTELPYINIMLRNNKNQDNAARVLVDSGSELNILKHNQVNNLLNKKTKIEPTSRKILLQTAAGECPTETVLGQITIRIQCRSNSNELFSRKLTFIVVNDKCPITYGIIGMPGIRECEGGIMFIKKGVIFFGDFYDTKGLLKRVKIPCEDIKIDKGKENNPKNHKMNNITSKKEEQEEQIEEETNSDEMKEKFKRSYKCPCPGNPWITWNEESTDIIQQQECKYCFNIKSGNKDHSPLSHPCTAEFSDDPVKPSEVNIGEEILIKRDVMNTIQVPPAETNISHLNKQDQESMKQILHSHKAIIQTPDNKLGRFRYFQASFDVEEQSNATQKNRNINFTRAPEAQKKIEELKDLGVLEESSGAKTIMNFVLVKKFSGLRQSSKADKYVAGKQADANVKWRLATDASDLNRHLKNVPTIVLPRSEDIRQKIRNKIFSSMDISDQFFQIAIDPESRLHSNVYYMDKILMFNRLMQGLACSPYIAQQAMSMTFSQAVFNEWKRQGGNENFPYSSYEEFIIYYLDDILTYTDTQHGTPIHIQALESVMYALERAGWVISLSKCTFLSDKIKFLGVSLNAAQGTAEVDLDRAQAIIEMRNPRSCAEASSRVSLILYNSTFLPYLKKLVLPIHEMVKGGKFYWNQTEAHAYNEIKMLISLGMKNQIFDPDKNLVIEVDASKLAVAACIWQVNEHGKLELLSTASSILSQAQIRSPSIIREAAALTFALEKFEQYILGSNRKCYLLSDASALACLARSKNTSSRFYEQTILLTSYQNLEVIFLQGKILTISDVLSRAFNNTFLKETTELSEKMAQIVPPIPSDLFKTIQSMDNETLTDFLLADSPSEFVDIFDKNSIYQQKIAHKSEIERMLASISPEQSIITFLRKGWTNPNLFEWETIKGLLQQQKRLSKTSLEEIIKRHRLQGLKKMADELDVQDEFLDRIKRNYKVEEERTAKDFLSRRVMMMKTRSKTKKEKEILNQNYKPQILPAKKKGGQLTKSFNDLERVSCPHHTEGHVITADTRLASRMMCKIDKMIKAWMELEFLTKKSDLMLKCKQHLDQPCLFSKCETYKECLTSILGNMANIHQYTLATDEETVALCFYCFQAAQIICETSENEIILKTKDTLTLEGFQALMLKIFLFSTVEGEYSIIQSDNNELFSDLSLGEIGGLFSDQILLMNLSSEEMTLPKNTKLLSINITQKLNRDEQKVLFIEMEKELVEENFRKFSLYQESRSQELLEEALHRYQIHHIKNMNKSINDAEKLKLSKKYLDSLNMFIITTNLSRRSESLTINDIKKIQCSDITLKEIIKKCKKNESRKFHQYVLIEDILFQENSKRKDEEPQRKLVLPYYLMKNIATSFHTIGSCHIRKSNLKYYISNLYYHPDIDNIVDEAIKSCISCSLAGNPAKVTFRGSERTLGRNLLPGEVIQADTMYLPITNFNRNKAALVMCDTVTSYVVALEMPNAKASSTAKAIRTFFNTNGLCRAVKVDGGPEFGSVFQETCASMNVNVINTVPKISNSVSNAEKSIHLLKLTLNKVVSQYLPSKRLQWETALPLVLHEINVANLRMTKLSRRQLYFSPLHYHHSTFLNTNTQFENAAIIHNEGLTKINRIRDAIMRQQQTTKQKTLQPGTIVIKIADDTEVATQKDGTKSLVATAQDVLKILSIESGGLGAEVISLVNGDKSVCPTAQLRRLEINDVLGVKISPKLLFDNIRESRWRRQYQKMNKGMTLTTEDSEIDEINTIRKSSSKSILTTKLDYFFKNESIQIEKEIARMKYDEFIAFQSAITTTKDADVKLNNNQEILRKRKFEFQSLKRYNIEPLTDTSIAIKKELKQKVQFNQNLPTLYNKKRKLNNIINPVSMIAKQVYCVSWIELFTCLNY